MSENSKKLDFNTAEPRDELTLIPEGTVAIVAIAIKPGNIAGQDPYLSYSKDGKSTGVDLEFTVVDEGPFARRKLFQRLTLDGTTPGHDQAGEISRKTVRTLLESAHGLSSKDESEAAQAKRTIPDWSALNGLRVLVKIGIKPASNGYDAKNVIRYVLTPDDKRLWRPVEQVKQEGIAAPAGLRPAVKASAASPKAAALPKSNAPKVVRPGWADTGASNG
jgi:hypothetical protein